MTRKDELKAIAEGFCNHHIGPTNGMQAERDLLKILQRVEREAQAAGLERAACSCDSEQIVDDERAYHAGEFAKWCRAEAQRVKENM